MKNIHAKKLIGISIAAAMVIGTSTQAGKIVTDATYTNNVTSSTTAVVTKNKQFGFGGWNLDNVLVKIVSVLDYSTALPGYTFDQATGFYTPDMEDGQSFESEIHSRDFAGDTSGELRGRLHGKDWPVGQPSGIKIINDDLKTTNGKPTNCIINTSFIEGFYLDSAAPQPVICSSDFQTHKRFKVNMQATMVDNVASGDTAYGKPFDMVFNLDATDTDTAVRRYEVFQKINNYTGKRLDGFKIEVLDATGVVNPALTLSLGAGENDGGDIWTIDSLATFSSGLWGPVDEPHFPTQGFFDNEPAYFPMVLAGDNYSVAYFGNMGGSNYMELFGNWITSVWAPKGIFFDNDNDPKTDAELVAFYGQPPVSEAGVQPVGWYKGQVDGWAALTEDDVFNYTGAQYAVDVIEDTLNLGINYIVNIGENAAIGSTFTVRITPHIAADQTPPAYVGSVAADDLVYTSGTGKLSLTPAPTFPIGNALLVAVADGDLNTDGGSKQTLQLTVTTSKGESELVTLEETGNDTGIFTATLATVEGETAGTNDDGTIVVENGTTVSVAYLDDDSDGAGTDANLSATTTAAVVTEPVEEGASGGSGGGFDASDNLSLLAMIFGFLGIGAWIGRRNLAKQDI